MGILIPCLILLERIKTDSRFEVMYKWAEDEIWGELVANLEWGTRFWVGSRMVLLELRQGLSSNYNAYCGNPPQLALQWATDLETLGDNANYPMAPL